MKKPLILRNHSLHAILCASLLLPGPALAEKPASPIFSLDKLSVSLRYESLGVNTLGLDLNYPLPFFEVLQLQAGYGTSRVFTLLSPGLLPVDYGKLGLQYHFHPSAWIEPYAGLQLRFAGTSYAQKFPELASLNGGSISGGLLGGCLFRIHNHLDALAELNLNYPASFAFPYLSWALGVSYHFGGE